MGGGSMGGSGLGLILEPEKQQRIANGLQGLMDADSNEELEEEVFILLQDLKDAGVVPKGRIFRIYGDLADEDEAAMEDDDDDDDEGGGGGQGDGHSAGKGTGPGGKSGPGTAGSERAGGAKPGTAGSDASGGAGGNAYFMEEWTNSEQNAPSSVMDMGEAPAGGGELTGAGGVASEPLTEMMQAVMVHAVQENIPVRHKNDLIIPLVGPKTGKVLGTLLVEAHPRTDGTAARNNPVLQQAADQIAAAMETVDKKEDSAAQQVLQQLHKGNPRGQDALNRLEAGIGCCPAGLQKRGGGATDSSGDLWKMLKPLNMKGETTDFGGDARTMRMTRTNSGELWESLLNHSTAMYRAPRKWQPSLPHRHIHPLHYRRKHLCRAYRAARVKLQRLLHKSRMRGWLAEIKGYASPPKQVVVIMVSLMLLVGETTVYQYLGKNLDRLPVDLKSIWFVVRKAIDLNMRSPKYIVKRMQDVKRHAPGSQDDLMDMRYAAVEKLMQDITYKYAKRGSMAAAVSWKWVLLVVAERRMDDAPEK